MICHFIEHPDYSLDLEVLCTIPMWRPLMVGDQAMPLNLLASDFGFNTQREIRSILLRLKEMPGVVLVMSSGDHGRAVSVNPSSWWKIVIPLCRGYWSKVYGNGQVVGVL